MSTDEQTYTWDDDELEQVTDAYIVAALWLGHVFTYDEADPHGETREPAELDRYVDEVDLTDETMTAIRDDVREIVAGAPWEATTEFLRQHSASQFGHDLYLTRNGHGAGFWDRGAGPCGDVLTEWVKPHGEATLSADVKPSEWAGDFDLAIDSDELGKRTTYTA